MGLFCWNPWTGKESIRGFWNLVEVCSAPRTIDYSCFCRVLKRTICIKNIILWYELEQLQIGFHGVCPAIWPLQGIAVITSGPGQWGRGKAIRWGVIGMHAKEVTLAALIIHPHSQEEGENISVSSSDWLAKRISKAWKRGGVRGRANMH